MTDLWQPVARHLLFRLQGAWERNSTGAHLADLERSQWWEPGRLREFQLGKLRPLVDHAFTTSPFYRERLGACGFRPGDLTSLDQLAGLPILTKQDIQEQRDRILSSAHPLAGLVTDRTGGSTGRPLVFHRTRDRDFSRRAATIRHDRWTGWDIGHRVAYIWGHRGDLARRGSWLNAQRQRFLDRRIILDTSSLTAESFESFRKRLLEFRPLIYIAYANAAYLYALYLEKAGRSEYHRPRAIITSAEVLDPDRRATIERVLGCPVFNRYGSRETSVIASECAAHDGLHLCAESLLVEFVKDGRAAAPGEQGRVLVTDLDNPAMPFIRYEIGDVGAPAAPGPCRCGRGLPRMEVAAGRVTDFLVTPEGTIVSGASLTIYLIAKAPGIAQAQIIQEERGRIRLRIVAGPGYGPQTHAFLAAEVPRFFGQAMRHEVEIVDDIPCEASGKYRFSISRIDPAELF